MSSGHYACYATITTWEKLKEFIPDDVQIFLDVLSVVGLDVDEWHQCVRLSDDGDTSEEDWKLIDAAWRVFRRAFEEATTIQGQHLTLDVAYRDSDNGDKYDTEEASGGFFIVENVFHRTGAALRHHALLIDASWVEYG